MNIGLVGAPGSEKTTLAYQLSRQFENEAFDPDCGCGERKVKVIDHYVPEIAEQNNIAMGAIGDYLANFYVAFGRWGRERVARAEHDVVITCGTLIETAVYLAMHFVSLTEVLGEQEKITAAPQIEASLRMLAVLYGDIFTYDHLFYLPPQKESEEAGWIDQHIQAGLEGFKLQAFTPLLDKETRLQEALKVIRGTTD